MAVLPDLRDFVDRQADRRRGLPRREIAVVAEAAGHPLGERGGLSFDLDLADEKRRARFRLSRDECPGEGLQKPGLDGFVGLFLSLGGLVLLVLGQVEVGLVLENVLPAEVVARGAVELLQPGLVGGEVDEHVAVGPVGAAALLGRFLSEVLGGRLGAPLVGDLRVENDEARLVGVGEVGVALRADVDAGEITFETALAKEPRDDLLPHVLFVEAFGLIPGRAGDVGLEVVPVLARPGVEVRRPVTELGQRGVEIARDVAGDRGAEEDPLGTDALVHRTGCDGRGGAEEHRAGEPLGQCSLAEQRLARVDACRFGVRAVDIGIDDRFPGVLEVLRQLCVHVRGGERDRPRHDQR